MAEGIEFAVKATGVSQVNKQVSSLAAKFVGLQAAFGIAQKALEVLIKWIEKSIDEFREFEKNIAEISTLLETDIADSIYSLEAGIVNLSKSFGVSANELAEGMYQIISAAVDVKDSMILLEQATKASIAGLTDIATSVDVFTSILNAYGMSVYRAEEISDELFMTVRRGKLRFEDLASAMGYIVPIAANLGVSFREIEAVLSTVTRQGQHVDMATRGLALALQNIADPTKEASEAAEKYGVMMNSTALRVKGFEGFIEDLAQATKKYGTGIIPELIGNMRSMRVIMAAVGEEGILGFKKDLDLLAQSSGRTEKALSNMMDVSQKRVELLDQSMQELNRSIGAAWSDIDVWWKKSQLWWGTFLGSGFNFGKANKSLDSYNERILELNKNMYQLIKSQVLGADAMMPDITTEDLFSQISQRTTNINQFSDEIKDYFDMQDEIDNLNEFNSQLQLVYYYIKAIPKDTKGLDRWISDITDELTRINIGDTLDIPKIISTIRESAEHVEPWATGGVFGRGRALYTTRNMIQVADRAITDITTQLTLLNKNLLTTDDAWKLVAGTIELSQDEIKEAKFNIMDLAREIKNIQKQVEEPYFSLGGHKFSGTLDYELQIKRINTELSRSQQYTNMAMKYGSEYLNDYNKDLKDNILTIYEYNKKQKELGETAKKVKDEIDKVNKSISEQEMIMSRNNLQIAKLQLKDMMKRHGLSRGDQKRMKKLEIENKKARIKIMEEEINEKEKHVIKYNTILSKEEAAYNKAMNVITEHYDKRAHKLWEMEDIRDSEISKMQEHYNSLTDNLEKYRSMVLTEYENLEVAHDVYTHILGSMNDELAKNFEENYKVTITEAIKSATDSLSDFKKQYDKNQLTGGASNITAQPSVNTLNDFPFMLNPILRGIYGGMKSHQRGTYSVPKEGLYHLHGGERVTPRTSGKKTGSNIIVHVDPISINAVLKRSDDIESIGSKIGQAIAAEFISGVTSEYEVG